MASVKTRAFSSRSAAASRTKLSRLQAGVMSASAVRRGNPCRRAARAPIRTKSTWCFARILMSCSGSRGVGLATAMCCRQKSVDVSNFRETFLGRQAKNARHVLKHMRIGCRAKNEFTAKIKAGGGNEPRKSVPARITLPLLDPCDDRLRRPGARGELSLSQSRPSPCLVEKARCILIHSKYDS